MKSVVKERTARHAIAAPASWAGKTTITALALAGA